MLAGPVQVVRAGTEEALHLLYHYLEFLHEPFLQAVPTLQSFDSIHQDLQPVLNLETVELEVNYLPFELAELVVQGKGRRGLGGGGDGVLQVFSS